MPTAKYKGGLTGNDFKVGQYYDYRVDKEKSLGCIYCHVSCAGAILSLPEGFFKEHFVPFTEETGFIRNRPEYGFAVAKCKTCDDGCKTFYTGIAGDEGSERQVPCSSCGKPVIRKTYDEIIDLIKDGDERGWNESIKNIPVGLFRLLRVMYEELSK